MDPVGRRPVRRRLFPEEPGDADNIVNKIREENQLDNERMKLKYNFDFEQERPLEGNFVWERIEPESVVTPRLRAVAGSLEDVAGDPAEAPAAAPGGAQREVQEVPQDGAREVTPGVVQGNAPGSVQDGAREGGPRVVQDGAMEGSAETSKEASAPLH